MARKRSANIANSLVQNSRSAFILAIEMHNRPIFEYRLQSVIIFIVHSWELLLKAYCYKYFSDKTILKKDVDNRYQQLSQILEKLYHSDTNEFRILRDNLKTLIDYRNLVMHSYGYENMDQLIYEFVAKSVFLYRNFICKFFPKFQIDGVEDTPLLILAFKLPYTPIDLLTNNFSNGKTSQEVVEFLSDIKMRIHELAKDGIEESIFINIKTEFVSGNNMKNSDLKAIIDKKDGDIIFQKETKVQLVNNESAQPLRGLLNEGELMGQFPISTKKELTEKIKAQVGDNWKRKGGIIFFNKITKDLEGEYRGNGWYPNTNNGGKRYSKEFYDLVIKQYE